MKKLAESLVAPVVPAGALIAALHEAIGARASLPVGELGKVLRLALAPRALADFKDRAGGLKRFVMAHAADFVVVKEHPYNHPLIARAKRPRDF